MQAQDVTRRLIFYVPGFDPFPLRRYRELYRKEAKRQAALAGYQISQLPPDPALGADWGVALCLRVRGPSPLLSF
jgi:hypothetical protein